MKVKVIINSCVIAMCFTLFSCSQEDAVYSCDKEVNAWVKENLSDIQKMSRAEWLLLDENLKNSVFAAFQPIQKHEFWKEKMQEVLMLNWNEQEASHLNLLLETVKEHSIWFDTNNRTESDIEQFEIFMYKWIEYAKEKFGWNKNQIGAIVASGNRLINKKGILEFNRDSNVRLKSSSESATSNCNCHIGSDFCTYPTECKNITCFPSPWGCGWLIIQACDGYCWL